MKRINIHFYESFKRCLDVILACFALFFLFPIVILIIVSIKLTSKGPVFFFHQRLGKDGKFFYCIKFRTMYVNAQENLVNILASSSELKEEWEKTSKLRDDPRITFCGSFLRASYLDEIPQFLNVLFGDLSIVGPRPLTEIEHKTYAHEISKILLSVRPGMTCFWQTTMGEPTVFHNRLLLDLLYIQKRSFFLDMKLIARTAICVLKCKGC